MCCKVFSVDIVSWGERLRKCLLWRSIKTTLVIIYACYGFSVVLPQGKKHRQNEPSGSFLTLKRSHLYPCNAKCRVTWSPVYTRSHSLYPRLSGRMIVSVDCLPATRMGTPLCSSLCPVKQAPSWGLSCQTSNILETKIETKTGMSVALC